MAFSAGFDAVINVNATDISAFTTSVKFSPARKEYDLEVLGANPVHALVGPVKTMIDLAGFIDPSASGVFTTQMAQATPTSVAIIYSPQGSTTGLPKRTCNAFVQEYGEDTASNGAGKWTAKLAVDGLVTYTVN
jgi:hypothetical protein